MKKIGFITTNKVLAQSLAESLKNYPDLKLEPFLLLNPQQAILDADLAKLDIALLDITDASAMENEKHLMFCQKLRQAIPDCHLLLLVSQDNIRGRKAAIDAIKSKIADDFIFYDTSLNYLFAKLAAI
ncbi:MAG TPA: hypothetical protein VFF56_00395 [Bacillota bacterium]|nr:hypothetical protein [Bacillota bacterium]